MLGSLIPGVLRHSREAGMFGAAKPLAVSSSLSSPGHSSDAPGIRAPGIRVGAIPLCSQALKIPPATDASLQGP